MIGPILRRAEAGRLPSRREIMLMLNAEGNEYIALLETARRLCQKHKGEEPTLRGLVTIDEESSLDLALEEAVNAWRMGCTSVLVREDATVGAERVAALIRHIKEHTDLEVALCLGERSYENYALWRQAGAEEYVLPHDCCNPGLYALLYPGHSPAERLTRYLWLKGLGYRVTGGLRVGLAGQTPDGMADDLEILRNADVSGVLFRPEGGAHDLLRMLAITRLCLPQADMWVVADDLVIQSQALACGANLLVTSLPGEAAPLEGLPIAMAHAL
ncbi:MAG: hypothetical protein ACOY93_09890 [Bacillota bacterium]